MNFLCSPIVKISQMVTANAQISLQTEMSPPSRHSTAIHRQGIMRHSVELLTWLGSISCLSSSSLLDRFDKPKSLILQFLSISRRILRDARSP